jgi:hypothetical protein
MVVLAVIVINDLGVVVITVVTSGSKYFKKLKVKIKQKLIKNTYYVNTSITSNVIATVFATR